MHKAAGRFSVRQGHEEMCGWGRSAYPACLDHHAQTRNRSMPSKAPGHDLQPPDNLRAGGAVALMLLQLYNAVYACRMVMPAACLARHGVVGCTAHLLAQQSTRATLLTGERTIWQGGVFVAGQDRVKCGAAGYGGQCVLTTEPSQGLLMPTMSCDPYLICTHSHIHTPFMYPTPCCCGLLCSWLDGPRGPSSEHTVGVGTAATPAAARAVAQSAPAPSAAAGRAAWFRW